MCFKCMNYDQKYSQLLDWWPLDIYSHFTHFVLGIQEYIYMLNIQPHSPLDWKLKIP
jgi:hypothetical protein